MRRRTVLAIAVWLLLLAAIAWGIRRHGAGPGKCWVEDPPGTWRACVPQEEQRCEELRDRFGIQTCVWPTNPPR